MRRTEEPPFKLSHIQRLEFSETSGLLYLVSDSGAAGGIFIFDPTTGKRMLE
jgi:hypothetical protein